MMIHDSYGTHAGRTETLARDLRACFVQMYEQRCALKAPGRVHSGRLPLNATYPRRDGGIGVLRPPRVTDATPFLTRLSYRER
jgi:hypothetical protein